MRMDVRPWCDRVLAMTYDQSRLRMIFQSTAGRCHLCRRDLRFETYGAVDGWEVDHSRARASGGTDHANNLRPAHTRCNRSRQDRPAASIRRENGFSIPPASAKKRRENEFAGAITGGLVAVLLGATFGPTLIAAGIGAALASEE